VKNWQIKEEQEKQADKGLKTKVEAV